MIRRPVRARAPWPACIDALAAEAGRATALLDRLDQATLAKTFRGELLANGNAMYQSKEKR